MSQCMVCRRSLPSNDLVGGGNGSLALGSFVHRSLGAYFFPAGPPVSGTNRTASTRRVCATPLADLVITSSS